MVILLLPLITRPRALKPADRYPNEDGENRIFPIIAGHGVVVATAFALILLASGILGALAEYSAAAQAQAVIDDLKSLPGESALRNRVIAFRPWFEVVKYITPAIFIAIFVALLIALFS